MSLKKIRKALKTLSKIKGPSVIIEDAIGLLKLEIVEQADFSEPMILVESLIALAQDRTKSYEVRRDSITDTLKEGAKLSFNYEKKDGTVRVVNVAWDEEYNYDKPPKDSDFIFMYDIDDDFLKHFKLDKISEIEYELYRI